MTLRRRHTAALIAVAALGLACKDTSAPAQVGPAALLDEAWQAIDAHYAFFDAFGVDWAAERTQSAATLGNRPNESTLYAAICQAVDAMHSFHATLLTPRGNCSYASAPRYPRGFVGTLTERTLIAPRTTSSGRMRYARLDVAAAGVDPAIARIAPALGYVRIESFTGSGWGADIDEAIATLVDVRAMVIDVRANPGGNEDIGQTIAARFTDRERVYRLSRFRTLSGFSATRSMSIGPAGRRFTGPVALLTDRDNHSAAEDFTMMMRVLPQVVTVGDTTFGTSSNPLLVPLSNGWTLRIPQSVQTTPDGFVVEGHGLPPAIPVRLDAADEAQGIDSILRAAVVELGRRADPHQVVWRNPHPGRRKPWQ